MTAHLEGRRIVLGVSGGIAAYKAVDVCRRLVDAGAHVSVVMTEAATRFVGPTTFAALSSEPVLLSLWDGNDPIPHTTLAQKADAVVVAPATARALSAYATGNAADVLTATLIATRAPVVVCPAMHTEMWEHPAVEANVATLVDRGVVMVGPDSGRLAGGDVGEGRLADPGRIVSAVDALFVAQDLTGRRILVTAGGTREPIDPVRFIANRSSGKQGHALAAAAASRGATVTLVTTTDRSHFDASEVIRVDTAAQMAAAVADRSAECDVVIMAAAVADFRPSDPAVEKIKKRDGMPQIALEPTADILSELASRRADGQVLVGFAAETSDVDANAAEKLARKGIDVIVANDVSAPGVGFHHDTNAVTILTAAGDRREVELADKTQIAHAILDAVVEHFPVHP